MAISATRTVVAAYNTIQTMRKKHPEKFKKTKPEQIITPEFKKPQCSLVWNRDYSLLTNKTTGEKLFSVNTIHGRIKLHYHAQHMEWAFQEDAKFGTARLVLKHGKFYLHIPVTIQVPDAPNGTQIRNVVGVDRGIRFLATAYDSKGRTMFFSGRQVKRHRAHCKKVRSELQRRGTASARRRLREIGSRENRWMCDVDHCVSKALVSACPSGTLFVLEDLSGVRAATERVRVRDRYMLVSWAFDDLRQKLEYKAVRAGDVVIFVDPAFTSQTCPCCGHVERGNRNHGLHLFKCCNCGYTSNDDRVAGMNLHRMGIEYLMQVQSSV